MIIGAVSMGTSIVALAGDCLAPWPRWHFGTNGDDWAFAGLATLALCVN